MGKIDVLSRGGILRADEVVDLAGAAGLDLAAAATLLAIESNGGRNVWGSDGVSTGGVYVKGSEVTQAAYLRYKAARARLGAQGVGPTQLTSPGLQDRADARGGAWDWRVNCAVGFEILAEFVARYGMRGASAPTTAPPPTPTPPCAATPIGRPRSPPPEERTCWRTTASRARAGCA